MPPTRSQLSLRGSAQLIAEFFEYSIHSILYQRGIYPVEDFQTVRKYGLNLLVNVDDDVKQYIKNIIKQIYRWISHDKITKLVLVIINKDDGETVERWQFNINIEDSAETTSGGDTQTETDTAAVQKDIQAIIRQITASVTFLPCLNSSDYTFNVLVYTDSDAPVSKDWVDSDAREIENGESVRFKSFNTNCHKVDTLVSYKLDQN
ncbi:spindle checkpoint protein MAD2 [Cyberlindnera jadinii NRRL Y-1542]|uniref:HORMA domain-containing protein n=1 Tax=Cyberlindnera jadinii (strain ATCC 18201 / CBS 1600 / BCRC 20928 / JCM 3617 / NBRC 0987 / NRRL Y-1542) TaxID=983966 RepID=A0A1E4SA21_CYBJN|nr:HORMA domain-containing protein [Cyberlindnera jadinii NRRL Y-1542]ODV76377.1 HORMA domain-containing protein [Cyberlindnera jadinii NRRL Y-1542]